MLAQRFFTQQRPVVASRQSRVQPRIEASVRGLAPLVGGVEAQIAQQCRRWTDRSVRPVGDTSLLFEAPGWLTALNEAGAHERHGAASSLHGWCRRLGSFAMPTPRLALFVMLPALQVDELKAKQAKKDLPDVQIGDSVRIGLLVRLC
jgi:hypothetical protein